MIRISQQCPVAKEKKKGGNLFTPGVTKMKRVVDGSDPGRNIEEINRKMP